MTSHDGKYLVTAGDRVIKVWDYNMRLDVNFQVTSFYSVGQSIDLSFS